MGNNYKTAIIMEGGALRGIFTCGVIDVLMENGITFDGAAGISAGAVLGCNIKSKQIGRGLRYNLKYCKDKRYHSIKSLRKTGDLFNVEFCYNELPNKLDIFDTDTFKNNPMKFYCGTTQVSTGKAVFHECTTGDETDLLWLRASASMPIVSRVVEIENEGYLDGGIANSVPYEFMENLGYNRNLIVLTRPKGYRKKKTKHKFLIKHFLKKMPKIKDAVLNRYSEYNKEMDEIDERESNGISLVIRPPKALDISKTEKDPKKIQATYDLGRNEALKRLDEIKKFFNIES